MSLPVLLVSTATHWFGTARIPRALAHAGFEVSLLTPRGGLAEQSRFIAKIGHLPDNASVMQWVFAFAAMVKATVPRIVLPCDDMAFRLLEMLCLAPPSDMQPALHAELAALIAESLGDPACYARSVDKTLFTAAAAELGIRVPRFAVVSSVEGARAFAASYGFPVVLKRRHGFAANGVAICRGADALDPAMRELTTRGELDLDGEGTSRLLAQGFVSGRAVNYTLAAWKGAVLAGYTYEKLEVHPAPTGPATVLRAFHAPDVRSVARRLVRGFGMSGLFAIECIVDDATGEPYVIEINRRVIPNTHQGARVGVDLCAALHAALRGERSPSRADLDPGEEHVLVHFPQEWLRDPESRWLRQHPVDVPWDDPELLQALVALGRGR
jgi:predicted ATP-grasp superfamily ATP-dependent carboligase